MPVQEEGGTTTDTTDDEDIIPPRKRRKPPYNVKVSGGNGTIAIGDRARVIVNQDHRNNLNVTKVLANFDTFLQDIAAFRGTEKDRMECFVLTKFLPSIEDHAMENGSNSNDTLEMLARLGSPSLKCPRIAKHSLKLLDKLVVIDIGKCVTNAHIVATEKILRKPIVDGSFREELVYDQRRRIEVYCNVLVAMLIGRACEHLAYPYQNSDMEEILACISETEKFLRHWPLPKKDRKRFSLEMTIALLVRLLAKKGMLKRLRMLLDRCNGMLDGFDEDEVDSFVQLIDRDENGAVELFIIIKMLYSKINYHSAAYMLFKSIVSKRGLFLPSWNSKRERIDWHLALFICQILVDVTLNHNNKARRVDAAQYLASIRHTKAYRKSLVICGNTEKYIMKAAFAYDVESRRILLEKRFQNDVQEMLPVELLRKRLCTANQTGYMEISDTLCEDENHVIMRGRYNEKPIVVKAISVTPVSRLFTVEDQETTPEEKRLENEIAISRHLNSETNEHVPECYADDVINLPYHMVMEHAQNGDLHSYLMNRRERNPPSYREILKICYASANSMEYVHKKKVVHNQLNAEHLLVGKTPECIKITGFGRAKHVSNDKEFVDGYSGQCLDDDDQSLRWTAPEGLMDQPFFSFKSDIWAFGVLMYVVITCGDVPYADKDLPKVRQDVLAGRYLPKEKNMKDGYYNLMQRCFLRDLSFSKICIELKTLIEQCDEKDDRPMKIPESKPTAAEHEDNKDDSPMKIPECKPTPAEHKSITYGAMCNKPSVDGVPEKRLLEIRNLTLQDTSLHHVKKLKSLDHPYLVKVTDYTRKKNTSSINYEDCCGQRLSDYLVNHRHTVNDLTRFCAQICSAVNYLHSRNIVHCNLTLDNIVYINDRHVKVCGLQYTRSLQPCHDDDYIPLCTTQKVDTQEHLYRWHAQEVIQDGLYSKESDIWSLGMLMWTVFNSLESDAQDNVQDNKPFRQYSDREILAKLKLGSRPHQTAECPDWLYIAMTQCWLHRTSERSSSLSVLECLTHRTPWESYILQNWLIKHSEDIAENWPNLDIVQRCAVEFVSPSRKDVIESVTEEFADEHSYVYAQPQWSLKKKLKIIGNTIGRKIKSAVGMSSQKSRNNDIYQETRNDSNEDFYDMDEEKVYNDIDPYDNIDEEPNEEIYECIYNDPTKLKEENEVEENEEVEKREKEEEETEEEEKEEEEKEEEEKEKEEKEKEEEEKEKEEEEEEEEEEEQQQQQQQQKGEDPYGDLDEYIHNDDTKVKEGKEEEQGKEEQAEEEEEKEGQKYQSMFSFPEDEDCHDGYLPFYQTPPSLVPVDTQDMEYSDVNVFSIPEPHKGNISVIRLSL